MKQVSDVIVIGAGPIGIASAAHLLSKGLKPLVLEKGSSAGSAMQSWGHVEVFTPWRYVMDKAVVSILEKHGWALPDKEYLPKAREIAERYLVPASQTPELIPVISYGTEVIAISKDSHSKLMSNDRDAAEYTVHYKDANGEGHVIHADAVIDASGTWSNPNPIGLDGLPVPGEVENQNSITYGIPDVLNTQRADYEGKRTLVLGAGHSAINVGLDLLKLQDITSGTQVVWGLRKNNIEKLLGGGLNDEFPARGELGLAAKKAIDSGSLELLTKVKIKRITKTDAGLHVQFSNDGQGGAIDVDRIIVATGFRPDLNMLRELRLDIDHVVEAPAALAPLIDPNDHSCGTVKPHSVYELSHHDKNFFIVGMKSYGRAPTFLMLTGYEQVRSITAELAGDYEAARRVELVLPQTGVCSCEEPSGSAGGLCRASAEAKASSCSATPIPEGVDGAASCSVTPQKKIAEVCCR